MFYMTTGSRLFKVSSSAELRECLYSGSWVERLSRMSDSTAPLLLKLLVVDASQRATAACALRDDWFQ